MPSLTSDRLMFIRYGKLDGTVSLFLQQRSQDNLFSQSLKRKQIYLQVKKEFSEADLHGYVREQPPIRLPRPPIAITRRIDSNYVDLGPNEIGNIH